MPEYNLSLLTENSVQEPLHVQNKLCSLCHSIVEPTSFLFLPIGLCQACRDANTSIRSLPVAAPTRSSRIDVDVAHPHPLIVDGTNIAQSTRRAPVEDIDVLTPQPLDHQHYSTRVSCPPPRRHAHPSTSTPSPFTDITRIRVRSQGHHCLYPGATFQGTQKSGRNSYDVNVTIVDVDFSSSFLCGYLRIRGLTDDWPELTTYFDAEIIGSRYGFLTQNWGANEQEDTVHWSRFPAFRNVKHELAKPMLTMPDRDRGAVFMRWKERFLVPDHRVQDINGASFAGFYYVCVDFNPPAPQSTRSTSQHVPLTREEEDSPKIPAQSLKIETGLGRNRERGRSGRSASRTAGPPVATMSGFYFHQNSEPYQQLSLCHVPERTNSSFEFR